MYDARARNALRALVRAEDPDIRVRAAVSLGRLRDTEAVPALVEALWIATGDYERQEAVRWLGRLRDPRAVEPLIQLLPESRTRFLVVAAIGMIGDRRGYASSRKCSPGTRTRTSATPRCRGSACSATRAPSPLIPSSPPRSPR